MKYIRRLSLLSLISLLSAGPSSVDIPASIYTDGVHGPFLNTSNVTIGFISSGSLTYTGEIEYYSELTGNLYGSATFAIGKKGFNNYEFICKNYLNAGAGYGISFKFRVQSKLITTKFVTSIVRSPGKDTFVARGKKTFPYVCWGMTNGSIINEESYDFENMNEYFSANSSNAIDVSEISFSYYPNKTTMRYSSAYLLITDYENLFPRLTNYTGTNSFKVPLSITQTDNKISFSVNSNMYVNYSNLEMSYIPLAGFEATNAFFIPTNENKNFQNNEAKIIIEGAGFNESNIQINVQYFNSHGFFGNCSNSEYCIEGGVKE